MAKYRKIFAKNLEKHLKKGVKKATLCKIVGISRSHLDAYLSAETAPTLDSLETIAEALGTTPALLLSENFPEPKSFEESAIFVRNEIRKLAEAEGAWPLTVEFLAKILK